jgi:Cu(I)-responsive transcriptional regulator
MIGDLARRTGTKVNTVRFYEEIGLMPPAPRTNSGRRTYGEQEVRRLVFIRNGRKLGFSINEVRSLISLSEQPERDCAEAEEIARCHLADVTSRISALIALRKELERIGAACSGSRVADCKIIDAIATVGE